MGACSDVEVGYLVSEHAAYTQDSLHLYNIENRLEELINILNSTGKQDLFWKRKPN